MHTRRGGQSAARGAVAFVCILAAFGYLRNKSSIRAISSEAGGFHASAPYLACHIVALVAFLSLSGLPAAMDGLVLTLTWYAAGTAALISAGFTFLPPAIWRRLLSATGTIWIYALAGGAAAWSSVRLSWSVWNVASLRIIADITFTLVETLLRPFLPEMVVNRGELVIGSPAFNVIIGDACSGLEGIGLIVVFTVIWLVLFRKECRFPRALLIIPAGVAIIFLLNTVRIAALILIGNAGAPAVALGGFHSQAGWIGFNIVALGCSFAVPRISWFSTKDPGSGREMEPNPAVPWLLPFAFVLGAGMISRAASAGFEWLYPIRVAAAVLAFWICRRAYSWRNFVPRLSWDSAAAGVLVFLMWIALDRGPHQDNGIGSGLASIPAGLRAVWILFRVIGVVITVPIAEELAFRGFLLRRLVSSDFESVDFRRFTWLAVILSSLAFGLMHGNRWIAGSLAGLAYSWAMIRRGNLTNAVTAHATTNALLAAWVLASGRWYFW